MDRRRSKLIICLSLVFLIILSALFIAMNNEEAKLAGAVVSGKAHSSSMLAVSYLPIIVFVVVLLFLMVYREKWY